MGGAEECAAHIEKTAYTVLAAVTFCHFLNDIAQSLIPAIYPILKSSFHLDFGQVGLITLTFNVVASLLQPVVGLYTDRRPKPYFLPVGMGFTLTGLLVLSVAPTYAALLLGVACIGLGSSVFHPESSRVARLASGGQHGLAQSLFAVGGNAGSSVGPLLGAFLVLPHGQHSIVWCSVVALLGIPILLRVGTWYRDHHLTKPQTERRSIALPKLSSRRVAFSMAILIALIFSKYFYLSSLTSYYTFYLITKFHVPVQTSQVLLFVFLGSVAAGTIIGGPIGDRFGRKYVIWCSILGVLPFTLALPYANLFWTALLSVVIGLILASAFSAIVVYGQDLMPGKIGTVSGVFFGFAFGMGGIGAAFLGKLADWQGITFVYHVCAYLPAIGLLTAFLPNLDRRKRSVASP